MTANIEIWKIFEDENLATYAFGDMGLFTSKAKGKVVILKKTGDIYLVEKTDKTLPQKRLDEFILPRIRQALTDFQKHGIYPDQKILPDSDLTAHATTGNAGPKDSPQWRNAVKTNAIKDKLDKILISFFAASSDGFFKLMGTGFVVAAAGRKALVMTASHIFHLHGLVQTPKNQYHSTAMQELKIHPGEIFPVDMEKIKAVYKPENKAGVCNIAGVSVIPEIDIALCALELDNDDAVAFFSHQLGLDSRPPKVGEEVVAMGFSGKDSKWRPASNDKKALYEDIMRNVEMRIGKVTRVFPRGSLHESWPCFETNIPVDTGMHGGPVLPFNPSNLTMNACAVVSADMSPRSSFINFSVSGHSSMAMIWPSLLLPFGAEEKSKEQSAVNNLLGLIQKGKVKDAGEADQKISIAQKGPRALVVSRKY